MLVPFKVKRAYSAGLNSIFRRADIMVPIKVLFAGSFICVNFTILSPFINFHEFRFHHYSTGFQEDSITAVSWFWSSCWRVIMVLNACISEEKWSASGIVCVISCFAKRSHDANLSLYLWCPEVENFERQRTSNSIMRFSLNAEYAFSKKNSNQFYCADAVVEVLPITYQRQTERSDLELPQDILKMHVLIQKRFPMLRI